MAKKIEFEERSSALQGRLGTLQESLTGLDEALRTAGTGARRAASVTRGLRSAFVHAAAPLTDTLNPALTELNTLTGQLGGRSGVVKAAAGLDQVEQAAAAAAKSSTKAVRTLAGFDQIIRLGAVADTTAKKSSGSSGRKSSSSSAAKKEKETAEEAQRPIETMLQTLKGALDDFWAYLRQYYAPAILAWGSAWRHMRDAALEVWPPLKAALTSLWQESLLPLGNYLLTEFVPGLVNSFSLALWPVVSGLGTAAITALGNAFVWLSGVAQQALDGVVRPALENALAIWQGMMQGITAAWQTYGQPIFDGILSAVSNLCAILDTLWTGTILPLAQGLLEQVSAVWQDSLVPLFADFAMYMGSMANLLLNLWNQVLSPLLNWLAAAFGPAVTQVCLLVSGAVTTAVGLVAGLVSTLLTALRGLADFLSDVLCGQWSKAWNDMADTAARVWERITETVRNAVDRLKELVSGFASGIAETLKKAFSGFSVPGVSGSAVKVPNVKTRSAGVLPSMPNSVLRVPALARGAVIPPNREFLAVLGDQRQGTNVEAPLSTIQQAVVAALQDRQEGELAALQQVTDTLRQILAAVYGIHIGDEAIGRAAQRYQTRRAVITGGY